MVNQNRDPATFTAEELRQLDSDNPGLARAARDLQSYLSDRGMEDLADYQAEQAEDARVHAVEHQSNLVNEYNRLNAKYELLGMDHITEEEAQRFTELHERMHINDYSIHDKSTLRDMLDKLYAEQDAMKLELDDNHPMFTGLQEKIDIVLKELYEDN